MNGKGKLFIISAPSGAGKTTLIREVLKEFKSLAFSVSHTTRSPRGNEQDGVEYFFINKENFELKIEQDSWLEWAKVHENYYGTSKDFVKDSMDKGQNLLLEIDVQGAQQIINSDLNPVTIFILPPSFEILSQRLNDRCTDSKEVVAKRLANAKNEMDKKNLYQYCVVNDDLKKAVNELCLIFKAELSCSSTKW